MKTTVSLEDFRRAFHDYGRGNQFSYEGLGVLFNWFEEMDNSTGIESELDVIAICCEFTEEYYKDIANRYGIDIEGMDESEALQTVIDYLQENTLYVGMTSIQEGAEHLDCVIFQDF